MRDLLPRPGHVDDGREALIANMWTEPEHRRRGLARHLLGVMLGWCREQGIRRVVLHASNDGRPLYEQVGFRPGNEMRLSLSATK